MENLEDLKKQYKLSDKEHEIIGRKLISDMLENKKGVENPTIIIDIAPPGSGKTTLNSYGAKEFEDNNVVIINGDEYRVYHPQNREIEINYPDYYIDITAQDSAVWTSELFDEAIKGKYNIVFEGTGRNTRILETVKNKLQEYTVKVRGMAVDELNCLCSILDRFRQQIATKNSRKACKFEKLL